MLSATLPDGEENLGLLPLQHSDVHVNMADVFGERSPGPSDIDNARFDGDFNSLGDVEFFDLLDVQHLEGNLGQSASNTRPTHPIRFLGESQQNGSQTKAMDAGSRTDAESRRNGLATYLEGELGEVGIRIERFLGRKAE